MVSIESHQVAIATMRLVSQYWVMSRVASTQSASTRSASTQSMFVAILLCLLPVLQTAPPASAQAAQAQSSQAEAKPAAAANSDARPILVELFTSEGCSSCPPADALVEKMDKLQPVQGAQLIVLSEHVDYWDHEGWKDANSSPALTVRQSDYVRVLQLKSAYTPQVIVDGSLEMRANNAEQVRKILEDDLSAPKIPVRIGEVSVDLNNPALLHARIEADGESAKHNADVYVAITLDHVESQVLHGENGGRHLTHVAVVEQITKVGKLQKGKSFAETAQLKLKPGTNPANLRIVAFVQESGPGKVLGAALRKPTS
jgi:hypothetical protein